MNTVPLFYSLVGVGLFCLGLYGFIIDTHLLRKILALNIISNGVFMVLVALARQDGGASDAVPQAMVITGIVVAVSATAFALTLMLKLTRATGQPRLDDDDQGAASR